MKNKFPVICIDDFFENPDLIVNYALSVDYINKGKNYPGKRSLDINVINKDLANNIIKKFLSVFYDENLVENIIKKELIKTNMYFQKISNEYNKLGSGWTHTDTPCISSGVIYLNKNPFADSGTTIKEIKKNITSNKLADNYLIRNKLYSDIIPENYEEKYLGHESNFEDSIVFKNKYNRMIMYSASLWHKQSNFYMNDSERLTIAFFINDFFQVQTPKDRKTKFLDPGYKKNTIYY
jgi:hypothetical protein